MIQSVATTVYAGDGAMITVMRTLAADRHDDSTGTILAAAADLPISPLKDKGVFMGWFLTRKSFRSAAAAKSAKREKWDRQRTLQGVKWLASAVILVALVAGWKYGQRDLVTYASQRGQLVSAETVELVNSPGWLHPDVQRDLKWLVAGHVTADPMDVTGLERAVAALAGNPWVESVSRIERTRIGLRVHAAYREPAAAVMLPRKRDNADDFLRKTDRFYIVDVKGNRLPSDSLGLRDEAYRVEQLKEIGLPVIVGVSQPAPKAGELWAGDDVQAGLSLSKLLRGEPYAGQIMAYDVAGRDRRNRVWLSLRTRSNGTVWWGLPPGQEKAIEPATKVKMQWLTQISAMKEHRFSIDLGGKTVALYLEVPTVIQPGDEGDPRITGAIPLQQRDAIHRARYDNR